MDKNVEKRYFQILKKKKELKTKIDERYKKYISPLEEEIEGLSLEEDEITLNEIKAISEVKRINLVDLTKRFYEKEKDNE